MSFGKAKRFNYPKNEIAASPADFYLSSFTNKSISIHKHDRFSQTKKEPAPPKMCTKSCHSPKSKTAILKEVITEMVDNSKTEGVVQKLIRKFEALEDNRIHIQFFDSLEDNEFIDDEFESYLESKSSGFVSSKEEYFEDNYTSSSTEELANLKKIDDYEVHQVYNQLKQMSDSASGSEIVDPEECYRENVMSPGEESYSLELFIQEALEELKDTIHQSTKKLLMDVVDQSYGRVDELCYSVASELVEKLRALSVNRNNDTQKICL